MKTVYVLNGPNLNTLGDRQPELYGHQTLANVEQQCVERGKDLGFIVRCFQSNSESDMVGFVHQGFKEAHGIVINAGAYSHTSIAILDALNVFIGTVIEVHISNILQRESFRHHSYISARADGGVIIGCGVQGYQLALERMATVLAQRQQ